MTDTWKPDFTKSNPYEGMPQDYAQKIYGTQAYNTAVSRGWIQPIQPPLEQSQTKTTSSTESQSSTFKPDFTKPNPYQDAPPEYIQKIVGTMAYNTAVKNGWIQPVSQTSQTITTPVTKTTTVKNNVVYIGGVPVTLPATTKEDKKRAAELVKKIESRRFTDTEKKEMIEAYTSGKMTSTIPFERKYYEAIDFGNNAGRSIWRGLTPWSEERGETIKSYTLDLPRRAMEGATQIELKETYEAEQDNPLWTRILFGGDTVVKMPNGDYIAIIAGEAPLISPAGKAVKTATIPINYEKMMNQVANTRLKKAWAETLRILNTTRGPAKTTAKTRKLSVTAAKEARRLSRLEQKRKAIRAAKYAAKVDVEVQLQAHKAAEAANLARLEAIKVVNRKPALLVIPGMYIDPKIFNQEVEKSISTMTPDKAITELNKTGLTSVFILAHPEIATKLLNQTDTKTKTKTITETEKAIQELTKTQQEKATKVIQKVKEETETKTETKTKPQEETETKTETEPVTETITKQITEQKTTDKKGKEGSGSGGGMITESGNWRLPKTEFENKTARRIIKESKGALAWRQGKLKKGDVWYIVIHPYTSNEDLIVLVGKQPEGATVLQRGKGSAYGTTQVVRGKAPKKPLKIDSGFTDITITPVGKKSVKMRVTADPKMETTGDITIGRRKNLRITPKTPKIR